MSKMTFKEMMSRLEEIAARLRCEVKGRTGQAGPLTGQG